MKPAALVPMRLLRPRCRRTAAAATTTSTPSPSPFSPCCHRHRRLYNATCTPRAAAPAAPPPPAHRHRPPPLALDQSQKTDPRTPAGAPSTLIVAVVAVFPLLLNFSLLGGGAETKMSANKHPPAGAASLLLRGSSTAPFPAFHLSKKLFVQKQSPGPSVAASGRSALENSQRGRWSARCVCHRAVCAAWCGEFVNVGRTPWGHTKKGGRRCDADGAHVRSCPRPPHERRL